MLSTNTGSENATEKLSTRRLGKLGAAVVLVAFLASCAPPAGPPKAPSRIGGRVFGVECNPVTLEMQHGETHAIQLADVGGEGKVTGFKVGTIRGDGFIQVSQPAANNTGWSALPGAVQVKSTAVDGPTRTVIYYIEILLGGREGDRIAGGNIWCQVNVNHLAPTPTFTSTPSVTPTPSLTPTPTPPVKVSGLRCRVDMKHGETKEIQLEVYPGWEGLTEFWINNVIGDGQIEVSAIAGGTVRIKSNAVDGPTRTVTYYIEIVAGGGQGGTSIVGANLWCQVSVHHVAPTPTPEYIVTGPPYVITESGFRVTYTGPREAKIGGTLEATFEVLTPEGKPAKGELSATLWISPSDAKAKHGTEALDPQGKVTVQFEIGDYPDGTILKLLISHEGKVYEFPIEITVMP